MKTPINSLITWVEDMENSVFALQASEIELKMLGQFKKKLKDTLKTEEEFGETIFRAGEKRSYSGFPIYFSINFKIE